MSAPIPLPLPKHSPLVSKVLVIRALMLREMATRFGKYKFGFVWLILEPLLGVLVIGLIIGTIAERSVPEIPYPFFLLNGMLILKLFTSPMNASLRALDANQGLLVYPNVKPLDPFLARFGFELLTTAFAFLVFCVVAMWLGVRLSFDNLGVLLLCYLSTWATGCGLGLIFGVTSAYYKEIDKVIPVLQRPLLFISAVLFPLSTMPTSAQSLLLYNPLVHTIELARNALFPFYKVDGPNLAYPGLIAVTVLALGLTLFHNHRNFLASRA